MNESPFQLGVTRSVPHNHGTGALATQKEPKTVENGHVEEKKNQLQDEDEVLRPLEDAVSWSGSSNTSDMLF